MKEKGKRTNAIPPICLWRAIASLFSNGTMIIGKAIGIRPIVPMAATLPFTQGRVVKGWKTLLKEYTFFLPFTFYPLPRLFYVPK